MNTDQSFCQIGKNWVDIDCDNFRPRAFPFVSAIGNERLIIYGGVDLYDKLSVGVVIDMNKNIQPMIVQNDFGIESNSHGVMIDSDIVVGCVRKSGTQTYCMAAFRPDENRIETLADF